MGTTNWNHIASGKELEKVKKLRKKTFYEQKERAVALQELIEEGWEQSGTYKNPKFIKVKKSKPQDEVFEDKVWLMLANMGFADMNSDRNFIMSYDRDNPDFTQQIDVFAADDETVLIVECKSAESQKKGQFKKELEALHGEMGGLIHETHSRYPGAKIKFIWAVQNYIMTPADLERMKDWNITFFSESTIDYYSQLVKHLGTSARYQLLGNLFANQTIKNLNNVVPAIQGTMGNHTYYSFLIEPENLLKIGYVLHRNEANKSMMPTYQRLIQKNRLAKVRKFVNDGGYFPNSVIISIDSGKKRNGLVFNPAPQQFQGEISKVGMLQLPNRYRSAYIIDGQHRLYGYSDSEYASKNTIPVVAFVDLDRDEQVKIFMDINENQKAVPKLLRVTLNADLLWDSDDFNERRQALRSKIAQMLGEETTSPLLNRIVTAENDSSPTKCITVEALQKSLKNCNFFSTFGKKNVLNTNGTFDLGDNEKTCDHFYPFLEGCLLYVYDGAKEEWEKGDDNYGILTINRGMQAVIRVINDVVNMLVERREIYPLTDTVEGLIKAVCFYLDPLVDYINRLSLEEKKALRSYLGGGADTRFWRAFQRAISEGKTDFKPEGLEEYWFEQAKTYNDETRKYIGEIEIRVKDIMEEKLSSYYGENWLISGLPKDISMSIKSKAAEAEYEIVSQGGSADNISEWNYVSIKDCSEIATTGCNWSKLFETVFVRPRDQGAEGKKTDKVQWMEQLNKIRNKLDMPSYSVSSDEFETVKDIYNWLIK